MEIRLLGPVEICSAGVRMSAGPPQQRMMLAALAVDVPRPVPAGVLIDRVWGEEPPKTAEQAVWTRISGLRTLLAGADHDEPGGGGQRGWVPRTPDGYQLRVDPDAVDLLRFRRLASQARVPARSDEQRVELLAQALLLWRGQPLAGLGGHWVEQARQSWQLERLEATVAWAGAALRLGQHADVIPAARQLAEQHPLSEPLAAVLVRALAADGRSSEAAQHCKAACDRIVAELGVEPGPELQHLQQTILHGRPLPPAAAPAETPVATPAQLPADLPGFAGRTEHLTRLSSLLPSAAEAATTVVISAVSGTAGVGKTTLAVHWAHQVADRFPDGQLYVNLRGYDPGRQIVEPAAAVRAFLDALGVPPERIPAGLDAQTGLYRSVLAGKRMLVVIDNARDADHARPLLPGTRTALAVITSRNPLTDLIATVGAHPLALNLLTDTEAHGLLERRLTPSRVTAEPTAVNQIINACARLPLALTLVAARAAAHPTFTLTALAAELTDTGRRLYDTGDVVGQVQAVFSWSYTTLSPPAAHLFRLLGLHPGPHTTAPASASLLGLPLTRTRPLLAELTRAGLLDEQTPGRYGFHDLLAAYATHLTHATDTAEERETATVRLLDHYTHTAHTADCHLYPARDPIQVPLTSPAPGTTPEQLSDYDAATAWMDAEHLVLLAAQRLAANAGRDTHAWQLAWALHPMLHQRGRWHEQVGAWQAALAAADRLPHPAAATTHRYLGWGVLRLGDHDQADAYLHHALHLETEADDKVGQANTHVNLSYLWQWRDQPARALDHAQQALTLFQTAGHLRGQATALNSVGWYHALLGHHTNAITHCQQALALHQQLGDRTGEAATWDSLGYAHHRLEQYTQAADCYGRALSLFRDLDDHYEEAGTLTHLGDTHHAAGNPTAARTAWTIALDILTNLHNPDTDALCAKIRDVNQTTPSAPSH
jgi:DNA-binding SARP family transcriptional activator/tetratricopeptide (TPR) repeat protein